MAFRSIIYVCNEYQAWVLGGGIGVFTREIGERLSELGVKVHVIGCSEMLKKVTIFREKNVVAKGIPYYRFPRFAPYLNRLWLSLHIRAMLTQSDADVIECPEYLGWLWPLRQPRPVVIRFHSSSRLSLWEDLGCKETLPQWARFERRTILNGTKYCAVSHYLAKRIKETLPLMANKELEVIPNGVDTSFFAPFEGNYRSDDSVVFVGKITQQKGVLELLSAWQRVHKMNQRATLYLIGRDGPGLSNGSSMTDELTAQFRHTVSNGSVQFLGLADKNKVREVLLRATLSVFPSRHEANPISLLEAMACACPMIGSNHTGFPEVIQTGHDGILCDTGNEAELAEEILHLLADRGLRKRLGANARQTVLERFDSRKLLEKNLDLYERTLAAT